MSDASGTSPILAPLIDAFAKAIRPLLGLLMIHTIFGAILIPLLITVTYLSTSKQRRGYMFWSVFFDILLGLGVACWQVSSMLGILLNPLGGVSKASYIAFALVQGLANCIVDWTLLLRLYAVYPISSTGKATFVAIFSFPVAVTTARIVIVCTGTALYAKTVTNVTDPTLAASSNVGLVHMPLFKVEGALALAEHIYISTLFLYKLYGGFASSSESGRVSDGSENSFTSRIRTLFYIALGNLVFPVIFNIGLLSVLFTGNNIDVIYISPSNMYVNILGVVFATVWNSANSHRQVEGQDRIQSAPNGSDPLQFKKEITGYGPHPNTPYSTTIEMDSTCSNFHRLS